VAREIDEACAEEAFIEEAVEHHRRAGALRAEFDRAMRGVVVTVRSADGLVEVVVAGDGTIRDVAITGPLTGRGGAQLARSIRDAVRATADAASWARATLSAEVFGHRPPGDGTR
jgi:DNA-binding protein YbaB